MQTLPDFPENLATVPEVAKLLKVSPSWVYKEVEAGRLPCIRIGPTMIRFDLAAVKRFFTTESKTAPQAAK